jgi:hypothetical protein
MKTDVSAFQHKSVEAAKISLFMIAGAKKT